jgi:beta-lactamase regulating signal transducer with metallopeptidase domain
MTEAQFLNFVGTAALKGAGIISLAGLVTVAWRSASAAARHLIWTVAVVTALMLPALGVAIQRMNAPRIEIPSWTENVTAVVEPLAAEQKGPGVTIDQSPASNEATSQASAMIDAAPIVIGPASQPNKPDFGAMLFPLWLSGVLLSLLPLALARIRVYRLARKSVTVTDGRWIDIMRSTPAIARFAGRVRVLESQGAGMPMTWGITRATLLVPSGAEHWPDWRCREILLHELAHVERRDCLTQLIAQITCAFYWFNPLTWVASHRMRVERELACDDRVITAGARASDYASNLLNVARSLRAPAFTSTSAIAMARPSQLSGRLLAVLDERRNRRSVTRRIALATSAAAAVITLLVASLTTASAATVRAENPPDSPVGEAEVAQTSAAFAPLSATMAVIRAVQVPSVGSLQTRASEMLNLAHPLRTVPLPMLSIAAAACWNNDKDHTGVSIHSDDNSHNGRTSWTVTVSNDECSLELRAEGKFTMRADLSDVESISNDGWVRIEEREGRTSRRVEMRRADNGSIDHVYWVNGNRAAFDNDAKGWLAQTLLAVERRTAFAASTRVPQLYRSGGLRGVLSEISQMTSDYPKSQYYGTLLDMGVTLDANSLNDVVRQAATELSSSDYYMSEVLGKLGNQSAANETTWRAFAEAAGRMKSDYYKSETLKKVLSKGKLSSETVGILLKSAAGIKSDYYTTDLLKQVAAKYALNAETRAYYVDALRHIESDYYRGELLKALGTEGEWDSRTSAFVLESVASIKSDYYRSESLVSLVKAKHVDNWPAFFAATSSMGSDYYKKTSLTVVLRGADLNREIVVGVLGAAAKILSDSEMADVLSAVARSYRNDESVRPAYEKAVDAMSSEYYSGAAMSALRRSMAAR